MKSRVLVAEDDPLLREILLEGLETEGFEVTAAEDGASALALYRSQGPFDVVLLDEEMPNLRGRELLAKLREEGDAVPALIVSGNLDLNDEEQASLQVGPVLRKPVALAEIALRLQKAIARD